ncbi:hypothetical protein MAP00_007782 [Monascus purpureus]|nr:hypothetical protein MAP00_007782 [Monascus purpureus]
METELTQGEAGVIFYLTQFYKRNEIAFRLSIFYGMVTIAGAFSGLISFGVFHIKHNLPGWKYLFIIEGGATIVLACFAMWWLPLSGSQCHWFSESEAAVARMRLLQDGSTQTSSEDKLNVKDALSTLLDWRILVWAVSCFCYGVAQSSVSNFLPQMVALLGYSTVKTNLYTVAPYCVGTIVLWIMCRSSDHFRERSMHLASALMVTFIGYIILIAVDVEAHKGVVYFACFLLACGAFVPSSIFHSWHTNNVTNESQRAATVGFLVGSANCAGILFQSEHGAALHASADCQQRVSGHGSRGHCVSRGVVPHRQPSARQGAGGAPDRSRRYDAQPGGGVERPELEVDSLNIPSIFDTS